MSKVNTSLVFIKLEFFRWSALDNDKNGFLVSKYVFNEDINN